ncbi:MAG: PhnD/SsuA/transferrin family substrate-binding protein [Rhizobiaceae bacterium]|nr:PhnD/SsuA/transferrin family substrate-binding protein [Rhizobiaceae bacterium]
MIASLPMYDWPELRADTDALWQMLRKNFSQAGFQPPDHLSRFEDESEGWLEASLFFSQTCGYPYMSRLEGQVELLGTPHFDIDGWQGSNYSSAIVVRKESKAASLDDCRPNRFAFNSNNSLSGYRCMTPLVGRPEDWFDELVKSGGHRVSATMVADGRADIAAIDAMCWHLFATYQSEQAAQLKVLQWTPPLPGLPYITNRYWSADELQRLKSTLASAISEMSTAPQNEIFRLNGVSHLETEAYKSIILL